MSPVWPSWLHRRRHPGVEALLAASRSDDVSPLLRTGRMPEGEELLSDEEWAGWVGIRDAPDEVGPGEGAR